MNQVFLISFVSLLIPVSAFAANLSTKTGPSFFSAAQSLLAASSSPGNAYVGGMSVVVTAPVAGDLAALGGTIIAAAPVSGDELLVAGSISSRAPVAGDLRAIGGSITIEEPVMGDLVVLGLSVNDIGRAAKSVFIFALNTTIANGAAGPVTVYGNNISLAGDFAGDVTVIATGRLSLSASTTVRGSLSYEAPEPANIPASATIGSIKYTNVSYLPNIGTSRVLAFASVGFFRIVRILGALIVAGLLAGLFPKLTNAVIDRAYGKRPSNILLTTLLGFAVFVATPILLVALTLTFVGIGIALLLFVLYTLIMFLALIYSGILLGGIFVRRYTRRTVVLWRDGVLGMLVVSLMSMIPFVGLFILTLLTLFSVGALLLVFFTFAFSNEETTEML
jgi:hypothetical protein